jgi:hypothetical protein
VGTKAAIESLLIQELNERRAFAEAARKQFLGITSEIPSGLPPSDGVLRIRNAGQAYHAGLEAYAIALREYDAFTSDGRVPDRLRASVPHFPLRSRVFDCARCRELGQHWAHAERKLFAMESTIVGAERIDDDEFAKWQTALEGARMQFETIRVEFGEHRRRHAAGIPPTRAVPDGAREQ